MPIFCNQGFQLHQRFVNPTSPAGTGSLPSGRCVGRHEIHRCRCEQEGQCLWGNTLCLQDSASDINEVLLLKKVSGDATVACVAITHEPKKQQLEAGVHGRVRVGDGKEGSRAISHRPTMRRTACRVVFLFVCCLIWGVLQGQLPTCFIAVDNVAGSRCKQTWLAARRCVRLPGQVRPRRQPAFHKRGFVN